MNENNKEAFGITLRILLCITPIILIVLASSMGINYLVTKFHSAFLLLNIPVIIVIIFLIVRFANYEVDRF